MATIHVAVPEEMRKKLEEFQRTKGYMTLSEAVRSILIEFFERDKVDQKQE